MGLLDDAIREHLDLKRRRGADPTEIDRAEREALGPVRRGPEVTGEDAPSPDEAEVNYSFDEPEEWEPFEEDPESPAVDEEHDELPHAPARAPEGDPLMEAEPFPHHADAPPPRHSADAPPPRHSADASWAPESEPRLPPHGADPPTAPADPLPDESPPHLDQETEEYELEPQGEPDSDVLETTPEFLQDAPEHDRLWFEQRPPRDFDFDG
ncbi:MAG: hypothetical protein JO243_09815 [Solirubrobacterales bacterium]|nr:hypothetical protein [Solirubrobacterales bacterium]